MEQKNFGYWGRILRVDLTGGSRSVEEPPAEVYRRYIGGRTLALYYLLREMPAGVDPLGPDNRLVITTSPATGCPISGQGRHTVAARSPLTGGLLDSQCGGFWGAELKFAGWDGIIVEGRSPEPAYLSISDDQVEILPAADLWGKTTGEVDERLRAKHGKAVRILQCGPAGENRVRYAALTADLRHFAARGGPGAVMGSKNLRAIVVRGSHRPLKTANPQRLKELASWYARGARGKPGLSFLHDYGTAGGVFPSSNAGNLPTFNHQDCSFDAAEGLSWQTLKDVVGAGNRSCYACAVACKRLVEGERGKYRVSRQYGGPEYESIASLGAQLGIEDGVAVVQANELCNALGLDTISAGVTLSWAVECFERGLLTEKDTGGIRLGWNDPDLLLEMIGRIARREGFGDVLAEGSRRAAQAIGRGTGEYAMQIKGQELPAHEPRGKWAAGLGFAVSPTGADHLQAAHDVYFAKPVESKDEGWITTEDLSQVGLVEAVPLEDLSPAKVRLFVYLQYIWALHDVLDWCIFVTKTEFRHMRLDDLVEAVRCITGWRTNLFELLKAGERAVTMARAFNCREGFTGKDDTLPERLFEGIRRGTLAGHAIDRKAFEGALKLYYGMMGWDEQGVPGRAKLEELGLGWIAEQA